MVRRRSVPTNTSIEKQMSSVWLQAALSNTNTTNGKVTLDPVGAKRVAAKERRWLSMLLKLAATTGGAVAIAILLKQYPGMGARFRSLTTEVMKKVPASTRAWFRRAITTLRAKVPALRAWLPDYTPPPPKSSSWMPWRR